MKTTGAEQCCLNTLHKKCCLHSALLNNLKIQNSNCSSLVYVSIFRSLVEMNSAASHKTTKSLADNGIFIIYYIVVNEGCLRPLYMSSVTRLARLPGRILLSVHMEITARPTEMKFKKRNQNSRT